jgi:hypothetical protein
MAEEIEIIVTTQGFDKVQTGLKQTSDQLGKTANEAKKTGDALKNNLQNGSNQASQSLTNLSRIAQDAPFGFIGIANNLNPLVESFGRLKAESGSTGGALKALVAGLSGPAGLGLAFGVVTSAITFAQMGFSRWGSTLAKAKEDSDKFREGMRSAEQGALAQAFRFKELIKVIRDTTQSEKDRNLALDEANKILEPYGKKIDSLNISLSESVKLTDSLTTSLVNQAIALKIADKIADLTIAKNDKINEIKRQEIYIDRIRLANANQAVNKLTGQTAGYVQLIDAVAELNKQKKDQARIEEEINRLNEQYTANITTTLTKTNNASKAIKKNGETLAEALAKFERALKAAQATGESFGLPQFEINENKIKEFSNILNKIVEKFNVDPKNKIYLNLEARLLDLQFKQVAKRARDEFSRIIKATDLTIEIPAEQIDIQIPKKPFDQNAIDEALRQGILNQVIALSDKFAVKVDLGDIQFRTKEGLDKILEDLKSAFNKFQNDIDSAYQNFLVSSFTNIGVALGEALGAAITNGDIGGVFKNLFKQLAAGVKAFGEQLIQIGFLALLAKSSLNSLLANPYAAIAVGIALTALGSAISNLQNSQFAVGTRNAPGGMALVGERGPELVNLPGGSQVIPATQTAQMLGGAGGRVEVYGVLRGQDIFFSNRKYSQTYNRQT